MDETLERLIVEYTLGRFKEKFVDMGLTCVDELKWVDRDMLERAGFKEIQVQAFLRMKEAAAGRALAEVAPGRSQIAEIEVAADLQGAGAPCTTGLENTSMSISAAPDVVCTGATEAPAAAEDPSFCIVLDGANIMRWRGSTGTSKRVRDDASQLRCAFDWFRRHVPSCMVKIYLYSDLEHRCRQDANFEGIWDSVTTTPSREDVDCFLLRAAMQGMYDRQVIICTNDCFDKHKGTDICGQTIDAQWVKQKTLKYLFAPDASFQPAWAPDHPIALKEEYRPPQLPQFPGSSYIPAVAAAETDSLAVEVLGRRSCIKRVSPGSPAPLRCPGRDRGCELLLSIATNEMHGDAGILLKLIGVNAPGHRDVPEPFRLSDQISITFCPTCNIRMELRSPVGGGTNSPTLDTAALRPLLAAAGGFAFVASLWVPPLASGPDADADAEKQLARYCLDALVLGHTLRVHAGSHDRILNCTPDALRRMRRGWRQLLEVAGWNVREVQPVDAVETLVEKCKPRFRGTFTKLRALGLTQYKRIAMIDLDMFAKQDIGILADAERFPAPMAVARVNKRNVHVKHGDLLKNSDLCNEVGETRYGINAGLVILDTSEEELGKMLSSVGDPSDRSHLATPGPEQDFLTRWPKYRDKWRHLDLCYNFQLHQLANVSPADEYDRRRLLYEEVKVFHFSTEPKPSDFFCQRADSPLTNFADFVAKKVVPRDCEDWVRDTVERAARDWYEEFSSVWRALTNECLPVEQWSSMCSCPTRHELWQCPAVWAEAGLAGKDDTRDADWLLHPGAPDFQDAVALLAAAHRLRSPQASGEAVTEANVAAEVDPVLELQTSCLQGVATPSGTALAPAAAHGGSSATPQAPEDAPEPTAASPRVGLSNPGQDAKAAPRRVPRVQGGTHMDDRRDEILKRIKRNRIIIMVSSTGSGKSSAVPRIIVEECDGARVACTQGRRIAALSLARRVADLWTEGNKKEGREQVRIGEDEVGYEIGGCHLVKDETALVFMTTATAALHLLRNSLNKFTHLIIDEVHERTIFIDMLLTIIASNLTDACRSLNIILMSAAMDAKGLCNYFEKAGMDPSVWEIEVPVPWPVVSRRRDEIDLFSDLHENDDMTNERISNFIFHLHDEVHPVEESFLVFLPGKDDVKDIMERLLARKEAVADMDIKPVYGSMSIEAQARILQKAGGDRVNGRKRIVILATDVIESSVTIPDVAVVIDTVEHKRKRWDGASKDCPLTREYISLDEVKQRSGRTGRTCPGKIYQLVTKSRMAKLQRHAIPQIRSDRLEEMLLSLLELPQIPDLKAFLASMPDPPEPARVQSCMQRFVELNAVQRVVCAVAGTTRYEPTHFGRILKSLPLSTDVGNLVMNGLRYGIVEECVIMAAVHQRGEPFVEDPTLTLDQAKVLVCVRDVCSGPSRSDLIAGYGAYRAWRRKLDQQGAKDWSLADETSWCTAHYLSLDKLREIEELRVQIFDELFKHGYHIGVPAEEKALMRRRRRMKDSLAVDVPSSGQTWDDPVVELARLLRAEHANQDTRRLMHWCLTAAFLHGKLVCTKHNKVNQIKFEQRKGVSANFAQKERLLRFLNHHSLQAVRCDPKSGNQYISVIFRSAEASRFALRVCTLVGPSPDVPFKSCDKWGPDGAEMKQMEWCGAPCVLAKNSLAALPEDDQVTVVASDFLLSQGKSKLQRICMKCSVVPNGIDALVVLSTYHAIETESNDTSMQVKGLFFGHAHEWKLRDDDQVKTCLDIRKDMDKEFREPIPDDDQSDVVKRRQDQVLKLMRRLEAGNPAFSASHNNVGDLYRSSPQPAVTALHDPATGVRLQSFLVGDL